jgi:hypothetical protein
MKRSKKIALSLIASVSLTACSQEYTYQRTQREVYPTKEQCVEDWGDEQECEQDTATRRYYGPHYMFRSGYPYYYRSGSADPVPVSKDAKFARLSEGTRSPRSSGTLSSRHISRGGFGRSAALHGSGS